MPKERLHKPAGRYAQREVDQPRFTPAALDFGAGFACYLKTRYTDMPIQFLNGKQNAMKALKGHLPDQQYSRDIIKNQSELEELRRDIIAAVMSKAPKADIIIIRNKIRVKKKTLDALLPDVGAVTEHTKRLQKAMKEYVERSALNICGFKVSLTIEDEIAHRLPPWEIDTGYTKQKLKELTQ